MTRIGQLIFILITFLFISHSSDVFSASESKIKIKKTLRKARKHYSKGSYEKSIVLYDQLVVHDSSNFQFNYEAGLAYYSKDNLKTKCIPYFERAVKVSKENEIGDVYFYLGRAYHINGQYQQSIKNYNLYLKMIQTKGTFLNEKTEKELINQVKRQIEMCQNALASTPTGDFKLEEQTVTESSISPLGKEVNSEYDDYSPLLNQDNNLLYFTSRRPVNGSKKDWDEKYFESIFLARKNESDWQQAEALSINENNRHTATQSLSTDGNTIYVYKSAKRGSIFVSETDAKGQTSEPKLLDEYKAINSKNRETSIHYAIFGKTLYVVSDRPGGYGGRDIYSTERDANGNWSPLKNLGPEINTPYDEDAPFIAENGTVIYFSSNGHNSIGGFDIFYSKLENDKWGVAKNLGLPVNSPADDIYFIIDKSGKTAYFSSNRVHDNQLTDFNIYSIKTECQISEEIIIAGLINDPTVKILLSNPTDPRFNSTVLVESDGTYELKVPANNTYRLTFVKEGVPRLSSDFTITQPCKNEIYYQFIDYTTNNTATESKFQYEVKNVFLPLTQLYNSQDRKAILDTVNKSNKYYSEDFVFSTIPVLVNTKTGDGQTNTSTKFNNVLFDFDRSEVKSEYHKTLETLIEYLKQNPKAKINLSGYTDALGDDSYNERLALRRAKAVQSYLTKNGISSSRITSKTFGEKNPVQDNETPEGRSQNRRVEITVSL